MAPVAALLGRSDAIPMLLKSIFSLIFMRASATVVLLLSTAVSTTAACFGTLILGTFAFLFRPSLPFSCGGTAAGPLVGRLGPSCRLVFGHPSCNFPRFLPRLLAEYLGPGLATSAIRRRNGCEVRRSSVLLPAPLLAPPLRPPPGTADGPADGTGAGPLFLARAASTTSLSRTPPAPEAQGRRTVRPKASLCGHNLKT
jgi:hypothetical protein